MFQKILNAIRITNRTTPFENYLGTLQRVEGSGAPTREQARKDFLAISKSYDA